jgi:type IV secretion system protein VirB1
MAHQEFMPDSTRIRVARRVPLHGYEFILCMMATLTLAHQSYAMPLPSGDFAAIARDCAPSVSPAILQAVAKRESGLDPLALHDDTTDQKERPENQVQAQTDASQWLHRGDSVDVGLMQVNSRNFQALGLSVHTAFDPCTSLAAGAAVLRAAYGGGSTPAEQQVALLMALSRYNTGSPWRGILNGYARTVLANKNPQDVVKISGNNMIDATSDPNIPPDWNVAEAGTYAEVHGAPWLIAFSSDTSSTLSAR